MKFAIWILFVLLITVLSVNGQIKVLSGVPDYSQPPLQTLPSTTNPTNYCAPLAAVNIIDYWERTMLHPLAGGVMGGLSGEEVAEYLGWFMDTNDNGSPIRWNGVQLPSTLGTYVMDQELGLLDYIIMDAVNPLGFPYAVPAAKKGYFWMFITYPALNFTDYKAEIDSLNPVKVDFFFWNILPMGFNFFDPAVSPDSIIFYTWGDTVNSSEGLDPENPPEEWNLETGPGGIGHAVTGVGYLEQFIPPPPLDTLPPADYLVVHDNWANTPKQIAIPWKNISAMMAVHLPIVPDLTVSQIHTFNDSIAGFTDSLVLGSPVSLSIDIEELTGSGMPPFIVIAQALDFNGLPLDSDTVYYAPAHNKISSALQHISIDSLFIPVQNGDYDITARVFWDQNGDSLKNDPQDANPGNDLLIIKRTINFKIIYTPISIIPDVPDINQPPTKLLASTQQFNYCAPVSAANITQYWENVAQINQAAGVNAGLPGETIAEYIGWFMDTNNTGNPQAGNGRVYLAASGTYVADQDTFFPAFVRWDSLHTVPGSPVIPTSKRGYDWQFTFDKSAGFSFHETEITAGRPTKIDFMHWNISFSNTLIIDTLTQDTVYLYDWGTPVTSSAQVNPEAPEEQWNLEEGDKNIGHAVTGVGFTRTGSVNPEYAIVHDNWSTTHKDIAIQWKYWISTIALDPLAAVSVTGMDGVQITYRLEQNYPNPFNPKTMINYQIPITNNVELSIYNLLGQKVATLVSERQPAGNYWIEWDAGGLASGVYLYRLFTDQGFVQTRKLILLK